MEKEGWIMMGILALIIFFMIKDDIKRWWDD